MLKYNYSPNQITESDESGRILRRFYFDNNNLVKVVAEIYDIQGELNSKTEILFKDFDDRINPFMNKYYIKGAFFRAFSMNNYKTLIRSKFKKLTGDEFELINSYSTTVAIDYDHLGYPIFGDYY